MTEFVFDACWNRIGVRGDASCPRLVEYAHCRNCPVYSAAAAHLFDRLPPVFASTGGAFAASAAGDEAWRDAPATTGVVMGAQAEGEGAITVPRDRTSFLIFRISDEWLALPTGVMRQVVSPRPIHSLPHRRRNAVLGVVNVRGALTVCVSLADLLGVESGTTSSTAVRGLPRFLVAAPSGAAPVVFPVDEVDGIHRLALADCRPAPATTAHAGVAHARTVAPWREGSVGLLDADLLFTTLSRSLG